MKDYKEPHTEPEVQVIETIEGEIVDEQSFAESNKEKMDKLRSYRTTARKVSTKKQRQLNVSRTAAEHGYDPAVILIHISMGNKEALGITKEISAHERNVATTTLISYMAPTIKSVDFYDKEKSIKQIPIHVPKRGIVELDANLLEAPSFTEDYEDE